MAEKIGGQTSLDDSSAGGVASASLKWKSWHVATAAEAFVAAQFARFGYDVSVQYGANQPEYDLMIAEGERMLKVSVKGSQDGGWGLSQSQLSKIKKADYHGAAERWLERHRPMTALCLVQFQGVPDDQLPRAYLAWPRDVADRLKSASGGRGDTILWEDYLRGPKAAGAGIRETLPTEWKLTRGRVEAMLRRPANSPEGDGRQVENSTDNQ